MGGKMRPVTPGELRKAARNHAQEMTRLHNAIQRVAVTAARLTEILDRADDAPFAGGSLSGRADAAMGQLDEAYQRVASLFDDLESAGR